MLNILLTLLYIISMLFYNIFRYSNFIYSGFTYKTAVTIINIQLFGSTIFKQMLKCFDVMLVHPPPLK